MSGELVMPSRRHHKCRAFHIMNIIGILNAAQHANFEFFVVPAALSRCAALILRLMVCTTVIDPDLSPSFL